MIRRRFLVGGAASVVLVTGGTAAVVVAAGDGSSAPGTPPGAAAARATAEVTRRDLEERTSLDGTLGYGEARPVSLPESPGAGDGGEAAGAGTITHLPPVGTVVGRGQTLVEVDGQPVPLLIGDRPLWRTLRQHAGDGPAAEALPDGPDVEQLEANLVALGLATEAELTVDQHWTAVTTQVVKRWQEALGREQTGVVEPGDAVVLPGPVRVAEHAVTEGDPAAGPVLEVTGTNRRVTVDLAAGRRNLLEAGQAVEVELPGGTVVGATVESVSDVATTDGDGGDDQGAPGDGSPPTVAVVIALEDVSGEGEGDGSDDGSGGLFDQAPVTVHVVTRRAEAVAAVPVDALLALAEGGYAVERVAADGTTELVAVETGAFADGWVEITGEPADVGLAVGDEVVVPA